MSETKRYAVEPTTPKMRRLGFTRELRVQVGGGAPESLGFFGRPGTAHLVRHLLEQHDAATRPSEGEG